MSAKQLACVFCLQQFDKSDTCKWKRHDGKSFYSPSRMNERCWGQVLKQSQLMLCYIQPLCVCVCVHSSEETLLALKHGGTIEGQREQLPNSTSHFHTRWNSFAVMMLQQAYFQPQRQITELNHRLWHLKMPGATYGTVPLLFSVKKKTKNSRDLCF